MKIAKLLLKGSCIIYKTMKKSNILLTFIVMLFSIPSCSNKNTVNPAKNEDLIEKATTVYSPEVLEDEAPSTIVPNAVSDQEAVIRYTGEAFEGYAQAGADMIYFCAINPEDGSLYVTGMRKEESQFGDIHIEIPDNVSMPGKAIDHQGKYHLLTMGTEKVMINGVELDEIVYKNCFIWTITPDGTIERKLDVTNILAEERRPPFCFAVDFNGNYYFENKNTIIKLNPNGDMDMRWVCDGSEVKAIGCGKSGNVYCIYQKQHEDILAVLQDDGMVEYQTVLPHFGAQYDSIAPGTDTELLIFNIEGGVYAYNSDSGTVEQRISIDNLPVSGEYAFSHGFLNDGRFFLMVDDYKTGDHTFYYIPAGK